MNHTAFSWVDGAQIVGALMQAGALIWAITQFRVESQGRAKALSDAEKVRADNEDRAQEARKIEIYQRLEIESNRVFEFEARHPQLVPKMKRRLAPVVQIGDLVVQNEYADRMDGAQIAMIARKYYEMNCNLFEIAARLRRRELVDEDVFGSWIAWYFDTITEWGFRALWHDLRDNYTADLRSVFDGLVSILIEEWDIPHHQGTFAHYDPDATGDPGVCNEELERRRVWFYEEMGRRFHCSEISNWLKQVDETRLSHAHPLAYI
jgi:hypothetical protein